MYITGMNNKANGAGPRIDTDESLLFQIMDAGAVLESRLDAELGKAGLSGAKASVLHTLGKAEEALSLSELADQNCCVRSNITQLIDRLEVDGLVRRVNDPDDRRIIRAALTVAGRKAYEEAARIVVAQEQALDNLLTREEAAVMTRALAKLAG